MPFLRVHNVNGLGDKIEQGNHFYLNTDAVIAFLPFADGWEHISVHTAGGMLHIWESLEAVTLLSEHFEAHGVPVKDLLK